MTRFEFSSPESIISKKECVCVTLFSGDTFNKTNLKCHTNYSYYL